MVRGKISKGLDKVVDVDPRGRVLEPAEGKSTDPAGGIKQKELVELDAKVCAFGPHLGPCWVNAGCRLCLKGRGSRVEERFDFGHAGYLMPPRYLGRVQWLFEVLVLPTTWRCGQGHGQKPRPWRKGLPKFSQLARETASLKTQSLTLDALLTTPELSMVLIWSSTDSSYIHKALHFGKHGLSHSDLHRKGQHIPWCVVFLCTRQCATERPHGGRVHVHHRFTTQQAEVPKGEMIYLTHSGRAWVSQSHR